MSSESSGADQKLWIWLIYQEISTRRSLPADQHSWSGARLHLSSISKRDVASQLNATVGASSGSGT